MNNTKEILETIKMIEEDKLDIRTITMGISLFDCIDSNINNACEKIYEKIVKYAKNLVKVGNDIESEFGIPIVNKRIAVTPISMVACATNADNYLPFATALDKAAEDIGINFIGGFSSLVHKGFHKGDKILINSIPEVLASTNRVCSSVNVGSTQAGINMDAVKIMGDIILKTANLTRDNDSFGCTKLVVFTNAVEDNPFMAGAFHGVGEGDFVINIGISGPGVIKRALEKIPNSPIDEVAELIKRTAFKITRMGALVGREASKRLNMKFGIVDLSLAPTPTIGDSVAHILEEIGLESVGAHGTVAALAILNDAVKKGGVMACNHIGGLSGAFIPVSEDVGMIDAVKANNLTLDKLETMTCVCSVGLDMVVIPGDTDSSTISAIIADEMAIGMINNKTTAVRIIPAINKKIGDSVNFGGLLGYAPIMPIKKMSAEKFINRGGRIPAPIHSLKN